MRNARFVCMPRSVEEAVAAVVEGGAIPLAGAT